MSKKYMRSELAIKRDEWLESDEGKSCCDHNNVCSFVGGAGYLKNRIETAFLAGAKAGTETQQVVCDELASKILTGDKSPNEKKLAMVDRKFTSGNDVSVDRVTISRDEWFNTEKE
jgi:hypothetical protein